jgi:photosynthetic reaction center cytochrome c subunit
MEVAMNKSFGLQTLSGVVLALCLVLAGCERPPPDSVQLGYRGTGLVDVKNPRIQEEIALLNQMPELPPEARVRVGGPTAGTTYQNVKVLGDLSLGEFGRTMASIASWVAPPTESCAYCHVQGDFASDAKYTKVVARRMLEMVRNINTNWKSHVAATGVTCYTCHRGMAIPQYRWFRPVDNGTNFIGDRAGRADPSADAGLSSLPSPVFSYYLLSEQGASPLRVSGATALPAGNYSSIKQAEFTYSMMFHISKSLGVNCTYCHNSRSFPNWQISRQQRVTAWQALHMVRDINSTYLEPLSPVFAAAPEGRLGPLNDTAKVNCSTCHQGAFKPLNGAQMAVHFPAMLGPVPATAAVTADQPTQPAAAKSGG